MSESLDLDALERFADRNRHYPISFGDLRALIQRLRDAEGDRRKYKSWYEDARRDGEKAEACIASLERVLRQIADGEVPDRYEDRGPQFQDMAAAALVVAQDKSGE